MVVKRGTDPSEGTINFDNINSVGLWTQLKQSIQSSHKPSSFQSILS